MTGVYLHKSRIAAAFLTAFFGVTAASRCQADALAALPEPTEAQSLETVYPRLAGVAVTKGGVLLLPATPGMVVSAPLDASGTTRSKTFGPMTAQERHPLPAEGDQDLVSADWRGDRLLLFDGSAAAVVEVALPEYRQILQRTIPWDLLKPAADRGGEATRGETAELRRSFQRQWRLTDGRKFAGVVRLPPAFAPGSKPVYLVASRVANFPLLELECGDEDAPSACVLSRQCYLEGAGDLAPAAISGIAFSASRRLIVVADARRRRLVSFKFDSCFHVPKQKEYELPAKLKTVTNIAIDGEDRLWVTTALPDDYLNASLYFWPAAAW